MAESKREGGLYYQPDGTAVDAEGREIKGAPKRKPDTDPTAQPGAASGPSSEEKMGLAIATALINASDRRNAQLGTADATESDTSGSSATPSKAAAASTSQPAKTETQLEDDSEPSLPKIADLGAHLETISSADEVRAMQSSDVRKGAQPLYDARLAELQSQSQ